MPRKKKAKQPDSPATTTPLAEPLETLRQQIPSLQTAAELSPPDRELVTPESDPDRHRPTGHRNGTERSRPLGPRPRAINEPGSVFTRLDGQGVDFKLLKDADHYYFEFRDEPSRTRQVALEGIGFKPVIDEVSGEDNMRLWRATDRASAMAYAQSVAVWMADKDISHGRGR